MKNQHTYFKSIILEKDEFDSINQRIDAQYDRMQNKDCCFELFYSWSLLATVLGMFSGRGDIESTRMFFDCVFLNKLPEVSIMNKHGKVNICICIKKNEKKSRFKTANKQT